MSADAMATEKPVVIIGYSLRALVQAVIERLAEEGYEVKFYNQGRELERVLKELQQVAAVFVGYRMADYFEGCAVVCNLSFSAPHLRPKLRRLGAFVPLKGTDFYGFKIVKADPNSVLASLREIKSNAS